MEALRECANPKCNKILTRRANERKLVFDKRTFCSRDCKAQASVKQIPLNLCKTCKEPIPRKAKQSPARYKRFTTCGKIECQLAAMSSQGKTWKKDERPRVVKPKVAKVKVPKPKKEYIITAKVSDFKPPVKTHETIVMKKKSSYLKCNCGKTANPWTGKCSDCFVAEHGTKVLNPKMINIDDSVRSWV